MMCIALLLAFVRPQVAGDASLDPDLSPWKAISVGVFLALMALPSHLLFLRWLWNQVRLCTGCSFHSSSVGRITRWSLWKQVRCMRHGAVCLTGSSLLVAAQQCALFISCASDHRDLLSSLDCSCHPRHRCLAKGTRLLSVLL